MLQHRRRILFVALAILAIGNVVLWARVIATTGIHNDFASYLTFAYLGVHAGWPHLYDWQATRDITRMLGAPFWPNQYPPFTILLFVPLLYLPYPVAYGTWLALMAAALVAVWRLLAPGPDARPHLLLMLAFLPVGFSLWLGQVIPLVALSIAIAYRLLEARRDFLAGAVLAGLVLKPNLALLVPVVLVAAGRWRAVAGLGAMAVAGGFAALALLTPYGIEQYVDHLRSVTADQPRELIDSGLTLVGIFGLGPGLLAADLVVLAAVAWVAYARRREGMAAAFAASIAGSLLVTTYLHWQDLVMLLPAGWLWLRSRPDPRFVWPALGPVWLVANFTLAVPEVGLGWLALMTYEATRTWLAARRPAPAPLAEAAV